MITKYILYNALKKQLGDTQIGNNAVKEIQQFMNDSLNELCKELGQTFIEYNEKRKQYGLPLRKRIDKEIVKDFLYKEPEDKVK